MKLRPYQQAAVNAVYNSLRTREDNPCVVIPTGGGKTPVIAQICKDSVGEWKGRVLILAHVKELLQQTASKLTIICPEVTFGIYSAGLNKRDTLYRVIVAGIQSVYKRAEELGHFDLIIVDEAHLIPPDGDGTYRTFIEGARAVNPNVRVIGLTATPYRMKSGYICEPDHILNHVCYDIGIRDLILDGFLSPLVAKGSQTKIDTSGLHIRAGEFIASETNSLMDSDEIVEAICRETVGYCSDRRSCLIFATSIQHGQNIAALLRKKYGSIVGEVYGDTLSFVRGQTLDDFKNGTLKYLVNVNVLTTGFDAPNVDCIVLARPTASPGLYYQMVGRGFRVAEGKENCLILDFGGNILRHGPVDSISIERKKKGEGDAPVKQCPDCNSMIAAGFLLCPDCGHSFPEPEREQCDTKADDNSILSDGPSYETSEVKGVSFNIHYKRNADSGAPTTMRVDYELGWRWSQSEWVCFEHTGFARQKAMQWWSKRSRAPFPYTTEEAVMLAELGALAETKSITIMSKPNERFETISGHELGPIPAWREPGEDSEEENAQKQMERHDPSCPDDDVPF